MCAKKYDSRFNKTLRHFTLPAENLGRSEELNLQMRL